MTGYSIQHCSCIISCKKSQNNQADKLQQKKGKSYSQMFERHYWFEDGLVLTYSGKAMPHLYACLKKRKKESKTILVTLHQNFVWLNIFWAKE